mmetsp:Transcript_51938/g.105770  ORF Transcript_51938/g.105770 Transcript_51938/m.105770 type:complete len:207 (-) Transcript_51938:34-654(-)
MLLEGVRTHGRPPEVRLPLHGSNRSHVPHPHRGRAAAAVRCQRGRRAGGAVQTRAGGAPDARPQGVGPGGAGARAGKRRLGVDESRARRAGGEQGAGRPRHEAERHQRAALLGGRDRRGGRLHHHRLRRPLGRVLRPGLGRPRARPPRRPGHGQQAHADGARQRRQGQHNRHGRALGKMKLRHPPPLSLRWFGWRGGVRGEEEERG